MGVSCRVLARSVIGWCPLDRYLEFVAGRGRPNTLRAVAFDLKAFFTVIRERTRSRSSQLTCSSSWQHQRGDRSVVRIADRESGLSARTIARRLSSVSGLYAYLIARGDTPVRVESGATRVVDPSSGRNKSGPGRCRWCGCRARCRASSRRGEVDRLVAALRTARDRAMIAAMVLVGLRRCEVLGLRFEDVQIADRRLVIVAGKGGHHRVVPAANSFFDALGDYLHDERPSNAGHRSGVRGVEGSATREAAVRGRVGRNPRRRPPPRRAGSCELPRAATHLPDPAAGGRHGVGGGAGPSRTTASLESTRIYLHLTNDWLAERVPAGRRADRRRYRRRRRDAGRARGGRPVSAVARPERLQPDDGRGRHRRRGVGARSQVDGTAGCRRRSTGICGSWARSWRPGASTAAESALRQFARWMITEAGLAAVARHPPR